MTFTQISQYKIGDETVHSVDLIDYNPESGDVKRRGLGSKARVDEPREDFEFVGIAEDYDDPATVWGIWESIHGDEWAVETIADALAPPPGSRFSEGGADE